MKRIIYIILTVILVISCYIGSYYYLEAKIHNDDVGATFFSDQA
jgi:uncharacterized protein YxeA